MRKNQIVSVACVLVALLVLAACAPAATPSPTATEKPTEVATEEPTAVPTEEVSDLGTADNPIVIVFVPSGDTGKILTAGTAVTDKLTELTGYVFDPQVPTSYVAAVEAMCAGKAQIGALNTFSYVLATKRECAEVSLVAIRNGSPTYTGQIITRKDSGINTIADLKGKTFCRPDAISTSGWIMPSLLMKANGVDPDKDLAEVKDAGGHDGVVKKVYSKECDAGATFGDARDTVAEELTDVKDVVVIIATTEPIPNDTLAFTKDVPADVRENIVAAFETIAGNEDSLKLLQDLYRWSGVQRVDDAFYDPFRQFLQSAGVDVESYVP